MIGLKGYVSNLAQKNRAAQVTRQVPGVLSVQNCLVVDVDIKIAAARAVAQVPASHQGRVFVNAQNGYIVLNGEVPTVEARLAAEERAGSVPEVRGVLNTLRVPGFEAQFPEPRPLQPRIGAQVNAQGQVLGYVEGVVIHPVNRLVTAILVEGSLPDPKEPRVRWFQDDEALLRRKVVVPIHTIRHLSDTAVILDVDGAEAARFEDFDAERFTTPAAGWRPPYPYQAGQGLFWDFPEVTSEWFPAGAIKSEEPGGDMDTLETPPGD